MIAVPNLRLGGAASVPGLASSEHEIFAYKPRALKIARQALAQTKLICGGQLTASPLGIDKVLTPCHSNAEKQNVNLVKTLPSDHRYCVKLPELEVLPHHQAILRGGREQVTMERYQALVEETPSGSSRDLLRFLASPELEHRIRETLP